MFRPLSQRKPRSIHGVTISYLIGWLLLSAAAGASDSPQSVAPAAVGEHAPATLVDASKPVYPRPALHENREGWVRVSFDIDRNGRVTNATVVESVGGSIFETAAVRSVGRWRYTPAQRDGLPVSQFGNTTVVTFALNDQARGSSKRFADRYNDILELIEKKQLQRADKLARSVFDEWPLNLYELTKLWSLRAELALIQNDILAAESALGKATANDGKWLDPDAYRSLLLAMVHVDVEIGQFRKAIKTYETLVAMNPDSNGQISQTAKLIRSLRDIIDSDQTLATDGVIQSNEGCAACRDLWRFEPVRRTFTIANVDGELESVVLTCSTVRTQAAFTPGKTWHLPSASQRCDVAVFGNDGTSFRVYQPADP